MGLRYASVRHPNVVVMAPALTETAQPQNFKLAPSSRSSKLSLSLKYNKVDKEKADVVNGVNPELGMNGHSPPKYIYSINGLAKATKRKNEFIPIETQETEESSDCETSTKPQECSPNNKMVPENEQADYSLTQIGGYIMNPNSRPCSDMGLQKSNPEPEVDAASFSKDKMTPGDVDQLFKIISGDSIGTGELSQNVEEILQVISNIENNGGDIPQLESGASGEAENMFPMSDGTDLASTFTGFERDLFNDVDVMNMCVDDTLVNDTKDNLIKERIEATKKKQFMLQRKSDFLLRRLHKFQVRMLGKHVADEATGVLEHAANLLEAGPRAKAYSSSGDFCDNKPTISKSVSHNALSQMMRQLDQSSSQQANALAKGAARACRYFGSGSSHSSSSFLMSSSAQRSGLPGTILPPFKADVRAEIQRVAGELQTQLGLVQTEYDSELTASSSGCESCDEHMTFNNQYQHQLTIKKRCTYKWAEDRAAVACRWTWLQAQMADLDYKIRQQSELRKKIRNSQGPLTFTPSKRPASSSKDSPTSSLPNGYSTGEELEVPGTSARTRALVRSSIKRRKFVRIEGLHLESKKAARSVMLKCSCRAGLVCGICTGRADPTQPRDPLLLPPVREKVALLDPCFHPILSFPSDVSEMLHYDALMKLTEWQTRASRLPGTKPPLGGGVVVGINAAREAAAAAESDRIRLQASGSSSTSSSASATCGPQPRIGGAVPSGSGAVRSPQPSTSAASANHLAFHPFRLKRKLARGRRRRKAMGDAGSTVWDGFKHKKRHVTHSFDLDSRTVPDPDAYDSSRDASSSRYSPVPSPTPGKDHFRRKRENSYDIDNIVIPYSVAASTRPEVLLYKEIPTPKWRRRLLAEILKSLDHKNGVVRRSSHESEEEDISDEMMTLRHDRCEEEERKRFLSFMKLPGNRGRGQRRTDSRAESSGPNTPDPMSPATREGSNSNEVPPGDENVASPSPMDSGQCEQGPPATTTNNIISSSSSNSSSTSTINNPARRRTTSSSSGPAALLPPPPSKSPPPEVCPYETRVFPLLEQDMEAMLEEMKLHESESKLRATSGAGPGGEATVKQEDDGAGSSPPADEKDEDCGTPSSASTDSADSFLLEDPNDPEWTAPDPPDK